MEAEGIGAEAALDPEIRDRQMADAAQAPPFTDPYGRRRFAEDSQPYLHAEVATHSLQSEPFSCSLANASELRLGGAQGDHRLSFTLSFEDMATQQSYATRR